jgi:hypothetical protein
MYVHMQSLEIYWLSPWNFDIFGESPDRFKVLKLSYFKEPSPPLPPPPEYVWYFVILDDSEKKEAETSTLKIDSLK